MNSPIDQLDGKAESTNAENALKQAYRAAFTSVAGELVLLDVLDKLFFLRPCKTPEETARCNYAKELLEMIYGSPDDRVAEVGTHNIMTIIKKLINKTRRTK